MIASCHECQNIIDNENYYLIDARNEYFCSKKCLDKYCKQLKEKEDKHKLHEIIKRIFYVGFPTARQLAEIKRYREQEGLTYSQMTSILHYVYDIKQMDAYGESLYNIPKYKTEAREWYKENQARQERARALAENTPIAMPRKVNKTNTTRDKRRILTELNPEDV